MNSRLRSLVLLLAAFSALVTVARADVTENINQTYPFAADGVITLDNVNGTIEIVAWDKNEVAIEAEKKARNDEAMQALVVHFNATSNRLDIRTEYTKRRFKFTDGRQVRYKLMVPAGVTLKKINSVNSNITVEGVRGSASLATVNGRIRATGLAADGEFETVNGTINVTFSSTAASREISLESVNGSCTLNLPADANGTVRASSTNGSVSCDFPINIEKSSNRSLRGKIGTGTTDISLESVNGSLRIIKS